MTELKRVGILSVAKVIAIIAAVIGLIIGIFFALMANVIGTVAGVPSWISGIGIATIVIFPFLAAVGGFIHGAIVAILYNFAAEAMGGVDLELIQS